MSFPKKAMIMAAGIGQRMRPLTNEIPKPMVVFNGKPLIDHVLDKLVENNIELAVVNVHYKADILEEHLKNRTDIEIVISDERDALLETGGGTKKALEHFGNEPFIIQNSDTVWLEGAGSNLERLKAYWDPEAMDCLLLLALVQSSLGYHGRGDFFMGKDGQLRRRAEKEMAPFVFAGVSIMHPHLFADSPDGAFSLNLLWDRAIEKQRLFGMLLEGEWMHIGTPEALEDAEEHVKIV